MKPLASHLLLGLIAVAWGIELSLHAPGNDAQLLALGALPDSGALHGEVWRLLTYAFLHASWNHFLLNAALLAWVGPVVERRFGAARFTALFVVAAIASGFGIYLKHYLAPSDGTSVGVSGALFAFLGAAIVLLQREGGPRGPLTALWAVLAAGVASSFLAGVSLIGHTIGLVVGVAGAFLHLRHRLGGAAHA